MQLEIKARRVTLPCKLHPLQLQQQFSSIRTITFLAALLSTAAIFTVPSSSISIEVPASSVNARIVAPPLPITSLIFFGSISWCEYAVRSQKYLHVVQGLLVPLRQECAYVHPFWFNAICIISG